jgi:CRISPR type III-associated protein (TIGR04423 family)
MSNKITLEEIPTNINYEGYLWWSDKSEPEMYLGDKPIDLPKEVTNPFIIEGNLWDKANKTSYLIRFINGEYWVYKFELKGISKDLITEHKYLPNRMPENIKKLKFKEVWEEQSDDFCGNFKVLKPAYIAFVGFKNRRKSNDTVY